MAAVLDLRMVGWSMSVTMMAQFVADALIDVDLAARRARPKII